MQAECVWLVDPLDGTKSFVRDTPFFSTQIALLRRGELVLGVSSACACPASCAWAEAGRGAWLNGERDPCQRPRDALRCHPFHRQPARRWRPARSGRHSAALVRGVNRVRGYGDFVHYHLLARGALDVVVESDVNILDIAALAVIVREAGGQFTDLAGGAIDLDTTTRAGQQWRCLHEALRASDGASQLGASD